MIFIKNLPSSKESDPEQNNLLGLHKVFALFRNYKWVVLCFSLLIWLFFPILGIFFLLFYCQINLSQTNLTKLDSLKKNIIPLVLVLFTITVYISTFEPFLDTIIYIQVYRGITNFWDFDYFYRDNSMEPLTFLIPSIVSNLTNGSESWFLFIQSLTINTALLLITVIFMPEVYPLALIINYSTPLFYSQLFYMRQFYAFIFLIPAIYIENYIIRIGLGILGVFTHSSSLFYLLPLVGLKNPLTDWLNKLFPLRKYYRQILFLVVPLIAIIGANFNLILENITLLALFLPQSAYEIISSRVTGYGGDETEYVFTRLPIFDSFFILVYLLFANFKKTSSNLKPWVVTFLLFLSFFIFVYTTKFNWRLSLIFLAVPGFFYTIVFSSGKLALGKSNSLFVNTIVGIIAIRIFMFFSLAIFPMDRDSYFVFWDGYPVGKTIADYYSFIIDFLKL